MQEKNKNNKENKKGMQMDYATTGNKSRLIKPLIVIEKAEVYRKLVKAISEAKTIYYGDAEIVDVSYSSSLKNRHVLSIYVKGKANFPLISKQ